MHIFSISSSRHKNYILILGLVCLTLILGVTSMITGPSSVGLKALSDWLQGDISESSQTILVLIRLPRTLACIIAGGSLALSGMLLQTALHNPLASPGIIGVNSGAGLAVVMVAALCPPLFWIRGVAAFIGALLATLLIWYIASRTGAGKTTVILSGIAVSSLLAALIDAVISIFPETITDRTAFYIGGFASANLRQVLSVAPFTISSVIMSVVISRRLDLLPMGDEVASSLGLNVRRCRFLAIFCAAMLSASAVSVAGLLGFVGLIVPHMARKLVTPSIRVLLPVTFLLGICMTLACDIIGRTLFAPYEISAGIPLALLGAPFFLYLILSRRRHQHD